MMPNTEAINSNGFIIGSLLLGFLGHQGYIGFIIGRVGFIDQEGYLVLSLSDWGSLTSKDTRFYHWHTAVPLLAMILTGHGSDRSVTGLADHATLNMPNLLMMNETLHQAPIHHPSPHT